MTGKPRTSKRTQPPARTTKAVFRTEPDANRATAIAGLLGAAPAVPAQTSAAPDPVTVVPVAEAASAASAPVAPDVDEEAERAAAAELAAAQRRAQAEAARLEREQRLEAERAAEDEAERTRIARYAAHEREELERRADSEPTPQPQEYEPARPRTRALLQEALERAASEAAAGNVPTPLEVAPYLHQKVLAEVARDKKRGVSSTMTTVLLRAIGEAHQSGRLDELVASHKAGQKRSVPLFGTITVGTAPRGTTVRLQFTPSNRDRSVIDVLAQWHAVPMVVLVRLVLEDRYQRRTARAGAGAGRGAGASPEPFED